MAVAYSHKNIFARALTTVAERYIVAATLEFTGGLDMDSDDLNKIRDLHNKWLAGEGGERADLSGANLREAYLGVAKNADSVILETGETLKDFREKVVPQLLAAGGRKVNPGAWDCHSWDNCPMAQAFDIHNTEDAPLLLRPRVEQFVRLFDARLIPLPECVKKNEKPAPQATQEG